MQVRVFHNVVTPFIDIEPQFFRISDFQQVDHFLLGAQASLADIDALELVYAIHSKLYGSARNLAKGLRALGVGDMIELSRDGAEWLRYVCTNWGWDKVEGPAPETPSV